MYIPVFSGIDRLIQLWCKTSLKPASRWSVQENSTVGKGVGKDGLNADMEHSTGY